MVEMLLSFGAIALAAILGSYAFRFLAVRFGQNVAFGVMAVVLGIAFAVQNWLEKAPG
ncbi:hypothetical protein [Paramagnetospirillum marisnigri]|uniref:hypothetical protein n=1 Tax=Paramagnetospirillum marisnigri TaxID=1285242 RepID=UPI000A9583B4|nr:hypothetical protein [Paramagnetospirillum marisnigri]